MIRRFTKRIYRSKPANLIFAITILLVQSGIFGFVFLAGEKPAEATDVNVNEDFFNIADFDYGTKAGGVLGGDRYSSAARNGLYSVAIANTTDTTEMTASKTSTNTLYGSWGAWNYRILVGASGTILKTTDKGVTWTTPASGTANNLYGAHLNYPNNVSMAVGASTTILKSTSWGDTWTSKNNGAPAKDYYGVYLATTTLAVAAGADGTIIKTTDAGENWAAKVSGVAVHLRGLHSADGTNITAVGDSGTLIRSTDAGDTWAPVGAGVTLENLNAIWFYSTTVGYAVGNNGTILKSTNNGANWSAQTSNTTENLYAMMAPTSTKVNAGGANSTVVSTANNGTTWTVNQDPGINGAIRAFGWSTNTGDADYLAAGDSGAVRRKSSSTTVLNEDQAWANTIMRDANSLTLELPIVSFIKIKLTNFQTNEYASVRIMGYSDATDQAADVANAGSFGTGIKIFTDKITGGDFSTSAITSKTQLDIDNQNYMFTELWVGLQRHGNQKKAGVLANNKEYLSLNMGSVQVSSHKNMLEIINNSEAGKIQIDRIALGGPATPATKKSLSDSFPDDNYLTGLTNVEHSQAQTHPLTKNPQNPIINEGYNQQRIWSAQRVGDTLHAWGMLYDNSNGPYPGYYGSAAYPITQDIDFGASPILDDGSVQNRVLTHPEVFLDDDGLYKMIFSDYRSFINQVWANNDAGGVGLAVGGENPTDTFDIYPNALDPSWIVSSRGDINPLGEVPDSPRLTKTTGLNPDEEYALYVQSKYEEGSNAFREISMATGADLMDLKLWPQGNLPLPVYFQQTEFAKIIQRDIDDYIMVLGTSPGGNQAAVARSRSLYWWEPTLYYSDFAAAGEWDASTGFLTALPNEDTGIFDMFYLGTSGGATNTGHATMRIDGFDWMSLSAGQNSGNMATIEIEKPATGWNELKLNVDQVSALDTLKLEILDPTNNPIAGFTQAQADAITSAGTAVTASWGGDTSLQTINSNIKLKFYFEKTATAPRLYQYELTSNSNPTATNLQVDGRTNPAGVGLTPTMSWTFNDVDTGDSQSAYQIQVSSTKANLEAGVADLWDTNKTTSNSANILYGGVALTEETVYWWRSRLWDQSDNIGSYADSQTFATAGPAGGGGSVRSETEYLDRETVTQTTEYLTNTLTSYLAKLLPYGEEIAKEKMVEKEIEKVVKDPTKTIEFVDRPFGIPKPVAYPLMSMSVLLNLVWILRIVVTKAAPFIP